ncbi:MAG: trehalose-6-phosphate synthase [Chthoniobacter sp.]|uniref:alpha,alpha-trehalose-phosphate synthase (UDP-forming) n=1 Tax=Chthoniobacter sp. TaxID=2510640 RepID=UPI0032A36B34
MMHAIAETIHARTWTRGMLHDLIAEKLGARKLIVVANREPYIHRYQGTQIECIRPASGMATALHPIMAAAGGTWIAHGSGTADRAVVDASNRVEVPPEDPAYTLRRVWLTPKQEKGFYYGLSNEGLWPLCHMAFTRPVFRKEDWEAYKEVNALFARAVIEEAGDGPALIFIQDYHFALLPRMLKSLAGNRLVIAHFWHIPWPNREIFRTFPWHAELLDGLLGSDLLGFQVRHHCQNFLDTVDRTMEAKVDHERFEITRKASPTRVRPFPISIDCAEHVEHAASDEVAQAMESWRDRLQLGKRSLGIGLERLDYTKGIPERLRAFDDLLLRHPEWRGRVVFAQVAVPSRSHLEEYRNLEEEVDGLVAQINGRWRKGDWEPVVLLKRHFDSTDMMALHRLAQFCVVSSLHDGMNLVAKEFLASRTDEMGVLILSRFTGAHRELPESLEINPFAIHEVSDAMACALEMSPQEQRRRMVRLRAQVAYNNVFRWAGKFLSELLHLELNEYGQDATLDESLGGHRRKDRAAA